MGWEEATKNEFLDSITINRVRLHNGDPGPSGTDNELGAGLSTAVFDAASGGFRALNASVTVTGLTPGQSVTHFSVWTAAGTRYRGSGEITEGDTEADGSGEFVLSAPETTVGFNDPA